MQLHQTLTSRVSLMEKSLHIPHKFFKDLLIQKLPHTFTIDRDSESLHLLELAFHFKIPKTSSWMRYSLKENSKWPPLYLYQGITISATFIIRNPPRKRASLWNSTWFCSVNFATILNAPSSLNTSKLSCKLSTLDLARF